MPFYVSRSVFMFDSVIFFWSSAQYYPLIAGVKKKKGCQYSFIDFLPTTRVQGHFMEICHKEFNTYITIQVTV